MRRIVGMAAVCVIAIGGGATTALGAAKRVTKRAESAGGPYQCSQSSSGETGLVAGGELASLLPELNGQSPLDTDAGCYLVGTRAGNYVLSVSAKGIGEVAAWGYDPDDAVSGSGGTTYCSGLDSCTGTTTVTVNHSYSSVYCYAAPYVAPGTAIGLGLALGVNVTLTCTLTPEG